MKSARFVHDIQHGMLDRLGGARYSREVQAPGSPSDRPVRTVASAPRMLSRFNVS